jgi:tetratricopeptide (TPR) repeat protein
LQALSIVERPGGCIVHPSARADESARGSLALFTAAGDEHRALISRVLASVQAVGGVDVDATLDWLVQAVTDLQELGDEWTAALALFVAMEIHAQQRSIDDALLLAEEAVERFRRMGDRWGTSSVQLHLGQGLRAAGRYPHAQQVLQRGLSDARQSVMQNTVAGILLELATLALSSGDLDAAARYVAEASPLSVELGNRMFHGYADLTRATACYLRGDVDTATELASAAHAELAQEGVGVGVARADALLASCALRQGRVVAAREYAQAAATAAHRLSNAGLRARAQEVLAAVTAAQGDASLAAELLNSAAATRTASQRPADVVEAADVRRTRHAIG